MILERILRSLKESGITDIRIVIGYGGEHIEEYNRKHGSELEIVHNPRWKIDAINSLKVGLRGIDDDALILYNDILFDTDVIKAFLACKSPLAWVKDTKPWGGGKWGDIQVCIVKVTRDKLNIFDRDYPEEWRRNPGSGTTLCAFIWRALYHNSPVGKIIVDGNIPDVDYYGATDEGKKERRAKLSGKH